MSRLMLHISQWHSGFSFMEFCVVLTPTCLCAAGLLEYFHLNLLYLSVIVLVFSNKIPQISEAASDLYPRGIYTQ